MLFYYEKITHIMEVLTEKEVFLESSVESLDISRQLMSHLKRANIYHLKDLTKEYIESKEDKKFMRELRHLFKSKGFNINDF